MMGQAGGMAIADILFGKVNPSGKLAETFPLELTDTPACVNWPGEVGHSRYGEGLFIGYRYYDVKKAAVLFPFGFGLSYTTFAYGNARVAKKNFKDVDGVTVSVDVTNTGHVAGKEVVQVYVHDRSSSLRRPEKELKGFAKVELQPGETKTVSIALDFRAFAFYHPAYKQWITENGDFDLLIGASSADIRQSVAVTLESTVELPCILNKESTIREWVEDPRGKPVIEDLFNQIQEVNQKTFESKKGPENKNAQTRDMMHEWSDMPLVSVLLFVGSMLNVPSEETLDRLLKKVYHSEK
jgi:beta-glucosidase